jgi:hypothetical protein
MRKLTVLVSVLAIFIAAALPATARTRTVKTQFDPESMFVFVSNTNRVTSIEGDLVSKKDKCLGDRQVIAEHSSNQGVTIIDYGTATTDAEGHFTITGDAPASDRFRTAVKKKKVGKVVCGGDEIFGGPFT